MLEYCVNERILDSDLAPFGTIPGRNDATIDDILTAILTLVSVHATNLQSANEYEN